MNLFFSLALVLALGLSSTAGLETKKSKLRKAIFADYDKEVGPEELVTADIKLSVQNMAFCPHKQVTFLFRTRTWLKQLYSP